MLRPKRKKNGRYAVRWREGGRQRQQTFDRREVAERFATRLNDRLQSHGLVDLDQGTVTVGEFVVSYWRDYAIPNLATNTQDTYIQVWAKHLEPRVGHRQLRELTPKRLAALRAELGRAGVGDPTILKALTMLSSVLSHAVTEEELERNPLREIRKPAQGSSRVVIPPTPEQVEHARHLFLEAGDRRSATVVSLLAYAGLRTYSEIRLLEWRHVGDRALSIYATKTSRGDVIRMLAPLATDLAEWRLACGRPGPREPVITMRGGKPISESWWRNWRRRTWRPVARKAGLGDLPRPYDLRHSFASLLIWEGQSLAHVAAAMRHSAATCSTNYLHVMEEFDPDRRESAEDRIRRARHAASERRIGGSS